MSSLCQVKTSLDLRTGHLYIDAPGMTTLSLSLDYYPEKELDLNVCGDSGTGRIYEDDQVTQWLTQVTGTWCVCVCKSN